MALVSGGVAALGALISAYATYQQGQVQAAQQRYAAKVARNEAQAARNAADIAARNAEERHKRVLAAQRARYGAAGVVSTEGTPLIVQLASAEEAALEEARIRYGGEVKAGGHEAERRLRVYQAKAAEQGAYIGAATSAGSSLLGVASSYRGATG